MNIRYIKNKNIDKQKWDATIINSQNSLIYACSWYLDIVCDSWDALISDNYEYILPLPIKQKFIFFGINKPPFIQKFDIFSRNEINNEIIKLFLQKIPYKFIKFQIDLNINKITTIKNIRISEKSTQKLHLNKNYEELFNNFGKTHRKNIRKAIKNNIEIRKSSEINNPVLLKKEVHRIKNIKLPQEHYEKLRKIISYNYNNLNGEIYDAFYDNNLVASAFFAKFKNTYTIFSGNNEIARKTGAGYLIINEFVKNHANENALLDFAGSNIASIASWNLGFGAENCTYLTFYKSAFSNFNIIKNA